MGRTLILIVLAVLSGAMTGARAEPEHPTQPFRDCAECPDMRIVPAGRFVMGADDQRDTYGPAHEQVISQPFAIAVTETTFSQYEACVAYGGCARNNGDHGWGRGAQPVINVSWHDARDYAAWLTRSTGFRYRLPTEQEWEYAARAGTTTRYPWGDVVGEGKANCRRCGTPWSGIGAAPVGQFPPNGFGLFDMNGNVSEWVVECWTDRHVVEVVSADQEPETCTARVTRGGDWYYVPILSTSAARKPNAPNLWSYTIGFRVVREMPDQP